MNSAADSTNRTGDAWVSLAITCEGLKALGVPQASHREPRARISARHGGAGGVPQGHRREQPGALGEAARNAGPPRHSHGPCAGPGPARCIARARASRLRGNARHQAIWRQDCYALPTEKEHFGYKDGIGQPAIEGSDVPPSNPLEAPLKAGEFVIGYPDETGCVQVSCRRCWRRTAPTSASASSTSASAPSASILKANATRPGEEELLAAKMMGRWRSGAPLRPRPTKTIPGSLPIPSGTTHPLQGGRSAGIEDADRIAPAADEPSRRRGNRPAAHTPHFPPRHCLRAAAAGRGPGGRRRRPRLHVRLRGRLSRAAVRVRAVAVAERRRICRGRGGQGPDRRQQRRHGRFLQARHRTKDAPDARDATLWASVRWTSSSWPRSPSRRE